MVYLVLLGMEFINIETTMLYSSNVEVFEVASGEYTENKEVSCDFIFATGKNPLDYTFNIEFFPYQRKEGLGARMSTITQFSFSSSEEIMFPIDDDPTIRQISELMFIAWCYTVASFNGLCYGTIFQNDFLSHRSVQYFYDQCKSNAPIC